MPLNYDPNEKVQDAIKRRRANIRNARLPQGSPSWDELMDKTWGEIVEGAKKRIPGYQVVKKLLIDSRFGK
jgi:hypothetical protein